MVIYQQSDLHSEITLNITVIKVQGISQCIEWRNSSQVSFQVVEELINVFTEINEAKWKNYPNIKFTMEVEKDE